MLVARSKIYRNVLGQLKHLFINKISKVYKGKVRKLGNISMPKSLKIKSLLLKREAGRISKYGSSELLKLIETHSFAFKKIVISNGKLFSRIFTLNCSSLEFTTALFIRKFAPVSNFIENLQPCKHRLQKL